jgi:hypothetical protein
MPTTLNGPGESFANSLISQGKINKSAAWSWSASDENSILGKDEDWTAYGKHFLGTEPGTDPKTKAHWKYPFAKGDTLYRSALIAIRQRAGQQNVTSIFQAAGRLLAKVDKDEKKAAATVTLQFSAVSIPGTTPEQPTGLQGIAYSGGVIPGYGALGDSIIDLSNAQFAPNLFLLVNHDPDQRAGRVTLSVDQNRLLVQGQFSQATSSGKQVAAEFAEGAPWRLSVGIQSDLEYSQEKMLRMVNGQMVSVNSVFTSPRILEISLVPAGADPRTSATAFSAFADPSLFQSYEDAPMPSPDEIRLTAETETLKGQVIALQQQITEQRVKEVDALFADLGQTPQAAERQQFIDLPASTFALVASKLREGAKSPAPAHLFKPQTAGEGSQATTAKIPSPNTIFAARRKAAEEARRQA